MKEYGWIIRGGRVLDPARHLDRVLDVAIKGGRVAAVENDIPVASAEQIYDASGKIVTPGLIDVHFHGYHRVSPLSIPVDHYCLGRGVTTAVDAGSAGCSTFDGFRGFAIERVRTRLLAFLNISCSGLVFGGLGGDASVPGELESLKLASVRGCVDCIEASRDVIVGVKVRLSSSVCDDGRNEAEAFRRALEASRLVALPLMTHHSFSTIPLEECLGGMRRGDLYTHAFHGFRSTIIGPSKGVHPAVKRARDRGILFDVGHGQGSFNWTVVELCASEGFWPDTISTDLHSGSAEGPAYDLPTVMTRLLHAGMPLAEVVASCTARAAHAIGWADRLGALEEGREADITVLSLDTVDMNLEDCQSQMRRIKQRLVPAAVWRAGVPGVITQPKQFPNPETIQAQRQWWAQLEVRDQSLP
jgi:dihydroorotase